MISNEHLVLQLVLLRDQILAGSEETTNQLLVALQPAPTLNVGPTLSNIVLVLDDSGSMSGQPIAQVLAATRAIIDRLGPGDNLGIVGFADNAEVVHSIVGAYQRDGLRRVTDPYVWAHGRRGYGTNIAVGLERAMEELARHRDPSRVDRVILLTDGYASNPNATLRMAERISQQGAAIVSLGFGTDFDMEFMDQIAANSGGAAEYIDPADMGAAIANFLDNLASIQNQLTNNTHITLRFRGDHRVTDYYQTHPKVIYQGLVHLGADRSWSHRLADVERHTGLETLFTLVHPPDTPGRKLVAEVEVRYDVPAAGAFGQTLAGRVIVEVGNDPRAFQTIDSRVQQRYNDAFVEKQQFRARQLAEAGQVEDAVRVLGTIRKRGNDAVKKLAEGTIRKLQETGAADKEELFRLKMGTQRKTSSTSEDET